MNNGLRNLIEELIDETRILREMYCEYKGITEEELEEELEDMKDLDDEFDLDLYEDDDVFYAQVFYKIGCNNEGYYTKKALLDETIKHYTIIEKVK